MIDLIEKRLIEFGFISTETKIINLTPHPVVYVDVDKSETFPPSGEAVRLTEIQDKTTVLDFNYKTYGVKYTPESLPDEIPGTFYIVSSMVKNATERRDFIVPINVIRDDSGRITGCKGFRI